MYVWWATILRLCTLNWLNIWVSKIRVAVRTRVCSLQVFEIRHKRWYAKPYTHNKIMDLVFLSKTLFAHNIFGWPTPLYNQRQVCKPAIVTVLHLKDVMARIKSFITLTHIFVFVAHMQTLLVRRGGWDRGLSWYKINKVTGINKSTILFSYFSLSSTR